MLINSDVILETDVTICTWVWGWIPGNGQLVRSELSREKEHRTVSTVSSANEDDEDSKEERESIVSIMALSARGSSVEVLGSRRGSRSSDPRTKVQSSRSDTQSTSERTHPLLRISGDSAAALREAVTAIDK